MQAAPSTEKDVHIELRNILVLLNTQTGYDFSFYKPSVLIKRIEKRLASLQLDTLSNYRCYLHQYPNEVAILQKCLLIHVTRFFRDANAFEQLQHELLSHTLKSHPVDECFRVWIPACSTGEEAYSIAILLQECMAILNTRFDVRIFATDVSEHSITTARKGQFSTAIEKELSQERLQKYFFKVGDQYHILPAVRNMIVFALQDIVKDAPITKLNLLCCRNLLIYLEPSLQERIIALFQSSISHNGLLFLGPSENVRTSRRIFSTVSQRWRIYKREKNVPSKMLSSIIPLPLPALKSNGVTLKTNTKNDIEIKLHSLVKKVLTDQYTPSIIILDENNDIVYLYGRTSKYLDLPSGEMRLNFMRMIRPDLKSMFHLGIGKAKNQQKEIILHGIKFCDPDKHRRINISIQAIQDAAFIDEHLILIIIEDVAESDELLVANINQDIEKQCSEEAKLLVDTMHSTINQLQIELEELSAVYEESQATNEEMHASNAELIKLNIELENNRDQLSAENEEIKNLLDNSEIATLFLDKNLCIKQYTQKATDIIHLIPADVGRPVAHLESKLVYDEFIEDASAALRTQDVFIRQCSDKQGRTYHIKMVPLTTKTNKNRGVLITFLTENTGSECFSAKMA